MNLFQYLHPGNFLIIDLIAATTNTFNGVLLAERPDYYQKNHWTIIGLLLLGLFGGIGGGVARDVLLNKIPAALTNPAYILLCSLVGVIAIFIGNHAYTKSQKFRETLFSFMTSFSLPWYAIVGVAAGIAANMPGLGCILLGIVGPTAGRYLIDITAGKTAKQFIQGEWFVGTAIITSVAYLVLALYLGLSIWPATLIAYAIGFFFRVAALWLKWEEPMPRLPASLMQGLPERESLKEKMEPGWEPTEQ
jgi:uncharacterized membrane protein YeiH